MRKGEYIDLICTRLQGATKLNFQMMVGDVLEEYYHYVGKRYEMPSPNGGDDKNDGWVVEDALFYQIYAPTQLRTSLARDIQKKFEDDLTELLEKLSQGKWNGKINKYVFLVNTFDDKLPKDSDRFFDNVVNKLKKIYNFEFTYELSNISYIRRLLFNVNSNDLFELILSKLNMVSTLPYRVVTEKEMVDFIFEIGKNIMERYSMDQKASNYERISSSRKIHINDLEEKREEIERIIDNLDIVEGAINILNQDIDGIDTFENIKSLVIKKYEDLASNYRGVELMEKLLYEIQQLCPNDKISEIPTKYLVIYIFDHCDIFEKEEVM